MKASFQRLLRWVRLQHFTPDERDLWQAILWRCCDIVLDVLSDQIGDGE